MLIIKSIDRLGRDYSMIIDEWHYIIKMLEVDIIVIDMSLLDTRNDSTNLVGKFISDVVLQILSFVAETERENIRQRQAEGIRIAKEKGIPMGKAKYVLPENFEHIIRMYRNKKITNFESSQLLGINRSTFLKYAKTV